MVLEDDALDAAGEVGLPVLALGLRLLLGRELAPPAQLLQQDVVELGVAGGDVGTLRVRAVLGQQVHAVAGDAEVRAEVAAAVHHVLEVVVEDGRARVLELGVAVAGPRQAEVVALHVVAGLLVDDGLGAAQRLRVEGVHEAHVGLEALGRLAGVADGPGAAVDLAQHVLDERLVPAGLVLDELDVLHELGAEAELLREGVHDRVVGLATRTAARSPSRATGSSGSRP